MAAVPYYCRSIDSCAFRADRCNCRLVFFDTSFCFFFFDKLLPRSTPEDKSFVTLETLFRERVLITGVILIAVSSCLSCPLVSAKHKVAVRVYFFVVLCYSCCARVKWSKEIQNQDIRVKFPLFSCSSNECKTMGTGDSSYLKF